MHICLIVDKGKKRYLTAALYSERNTFFLSSSSLSFLVLFLKGFKGDYKYLLFTKTLFLFTRSSTSTKGARLFYDTKGWVLYGTHDEISWEFT